MMDVSGDATLIFENISVKLYKLFHHAGAFSSCIAYLVGTITEHF